MIMSAPTANGERNLEFGKENEFGIKHILFRLLFYKQ